MCENQLQNSCIITIMLERGEETMKKIKSFWVVVIMFTCGIGLPAFSHAEDRVITLPSSDGSDKVGVKNSDNVALMTVLSNGKVGIGTSAPQFGRICIEDAAVPLSFKETNIAVDAGGWWRMPLDGGILRFDVNTGTSGNEFGKNYLTPLAMTYKGNVGIGTTNPTQKLDVNGTTRTKILEITGGSDLSERFSIGDPINLKDHIKPDDFEIEPGMIACIDPVNPGKLLVCSKAYDHTVAGIISGAGGVNPGLLMGQKGSGADGEYPVALTGRVYCKVDTTYGSVQPGDLLTTSETPGYAMKVNDYDNARGAIIGKAMSSLDNGKGLVLTLISLQ